MACGCQGCPTKKAVSWQPSIGSGGTGTATERELGQLVVIPASAEQHARNAGHTEWPPILRWPDVCKSILRLYYRVISDLLDVRDYLHRPEQCE